MILPANTILFSEGDAGNCMYLLRRGTVRVSRREGSEDAFLADLGPGSIVGEMSLLDGRSRSATVTTLSETEFVEIDHGLLDKTFSTLPSWFTAISKVLVGRLRATTARRHGSDLRGSVPAFLDLLGHPPQGGWSVGGICSAVRDVYGLSIPESKAVLGALGGLGFVEVAGGRVSIPDPIRVESCYDQILSRSSPHFGAKSDIAFIDFGFRHDGGREAEASIEALCRAFDGSDSEFEAMVRPFRKD